MFNNDKLKIFYDAEFTGLYQNTSLISIGLFSGYAYFYAEFNDYDQSNISDWIKENVINNLVLTDRRPGTGRKIINKNPDHYSIEAYGNTNEIRDELLAWLKNESDLAGKQIQIYSDCYAYDWMLFNQLVCENGDALNLPEYIYYIPIDLSTALQLCNTDPDIEREKLLSDSTVEILKNRIPLFKDLGDHFKHNSLWDAIVCRLWFYRVDGFVSKHI